MHTARRKVNGRRNIGDWSVQAGELEVDESNAASEQNSTSSDSLLYLAVQGAFQIHDYEMLLLRLYSNHTNEREALRSPLSESSDDIDGINRADEIFVCAPLET
eukprot:IDg13212t1